MAPLNKQPSAGAAVSSTGRRRWFCHQESHGSRPSVTLARRGSAVLTKQHTHRRWKLNYFGHYLGENTIITDASRFSMVMRLEECERASEDWLVDGRVVGGSAPVSSVVTALLLLAYFSQDDRRKIISFRPAATRLLSEVGG